MAKARTGELPTWQLGKLINTILLAGNWSKLDSYLVNVLSQETVFINQAMLSCRKDLHQYQVSWPTGHHAHESKFKAISFVQPGDSLIIYI